ncbi:HdeD family acid-resistance protein [Oricola thermophila]|uniref:HdeD family acid-resistance protein n=1 Tax=Oricola thermophila TaxID=2742145 RepID=UPI001FE76F4F|nr:DUF308 domain-containing protein [Oricola thermophila]
MSSVAVVVMLGWLLVVSGILQALGLVGASHVPHFWLQLVSAALSLVVGFLFLASPGEGLLALTLLLIVFFIVGGMARIVFALTIRPFPEWGWILGSGIVGLGLGVLLFAQMPVAAAWLLGLLVGIQLLCEGLALSWMAWRVRRAAG